MHDAVTLANWIYTLRSPTVAKLDYIFQGYHDERYPEDKGSSSAMFQRSLRKTPAILQQRELNEKPDFGSKVDEGKNEKRW